jgi:hypothetical protein
VAASIARKAASIGDVSMSRIDPGGLHSKRATLGPLLGTSSQVIDPVEFRCTRSIFAPQLPPAEQALKCCSRRVCGFFPRRTAGNQRPGCVDQRRRRKRSAATERSGWHCLMGAKRASFFRATASDGSSSCAGCIARLAHCTGRDCPGDILRADVRAERCACLPISTST